MSRRPARRDLRPPRAGRSAADARWRLRLSPPRNCPRCAWLPLFPSRREYTECRVRRTVRERRGESYAEPYASRQEMERGLSNLHTETMDSAPLSISLFGAFAVSVRGQPMPRLRSRSVEWLLALLAL